MEEDPLGAFTKHCVMLSQEKRVVNLVRVTSKELGIKTRYCEFGQIIERAKNLGLKLCHPEVAFRLRIAYQSQWSGEDENNETFIATKPLKYKHTLLLLEAFGSNPSQRELNICYHLYGGHLDYEYSYFTSFVFEV